MRSIYKIACETAECSVYMGIEFEIWQVWRHFDSSELSVCWRTDQQLIFEFLAVEVDNVFETSTSLLVSRSLKGQTNYGCCWVASSRNH